MLDGQALLMTRDLIPILLMLAILGGCALGGGRATTIHNGGEGSLNQAFRSTGPAPTSAAAPTSTGGLVATNSLAIIFSEGLYLNQQETLRLRIVDEVLPHVLSRLELAAPRRQYTLAFTRQLDCALHGMARSDDFIAEVFTCDSVPSEQALAIMAHEIAHLVSYERYGVYPDVGSDLLLIEGLATYGAARYWLGDETDLRAYVRDQRASGVVPALQESYRGVNVDAMNANYYQWASFVEFLRQTCGPARFHELYKTGSGRLGSASYLQYCGKSIDALEQDWLTWLEG